MKTKSYEFEKGIVNVHFDCLPTKENLEKPCSMFMSKVLKSKRKSHCCSSDKQLINSKINHLYFK